MIIYHILKSILCRAQDVMSKLHFSHLNKCWYIANILCTRVSFQWLCVFVIYEIKVNYIVYYTSYNFIST